MMQQTAHEPIPIDQIRAARERIAGAAIHTPLVRLNVDDAPAEIYLKLENLQPIGSFKIRGAINAMRLADPDQLAQGVWTASTGNMAQGVAFGARQLGIPCTVVLPDNAATAKIESIRKLGAEIRIFPRKDWFELIFYKKPIEGLELSGVFIHPVDDRNVMAGHGTMGLEILEDLPDVDAVLAPYGGGGLTCGVASAVRALRPATRFYACELEVGAPLAAALAAGKPVVTEREATPPFAGGFSGSTTVIENVFALVRQLIEGSLTMSLPDLVSAIRILAERNHIIAEGAGAAPVAGALQGKAGAGKVVCVVSGGHIALGELAAMLGEER